MGSILRVLHSQAQINSAPPTREDLNRAYVVYFFPSRLSVSVGFTSSNQLEFLFLVPQLGYLKAGKSKDFVV